MEFLLGFIVYPLVRKVLIDLFVWPYMRGKYKQWQKDERKRAIIAHRRERHEAKLVHCETSACATL